MIPKKIVVLASGSGSNLKALLDADLGAGEIVGVVSDNPKAKALERAAQKGVDTAQVLMKDFVSREEWNEALTDVVLGFSPDLVVLAGFMRVLAPVFVERFVIMNVHPALLPAFPGAHGARDAIMHGVKVSGCTVHLVDNGVDTGPIIAQEVVPVVDGDTEESLQKRIQEKEHVLYPKVVRDWCLGRYEVFEYENNENNIARTHVRYVG